MIPSAEMIAQIGSTEAQQDHINDKVDPSHLGPDDPFGPSKEVLGLGLLKVEVDLLQDVFSLGRDHSSVVLKFLNGLLELGFGDVVQYPFCIPSPVKDFGLLALELDQLLAVDQVVRETEKAAGQDVHFGAFGNLDQLLGGA